MKNLEKNLENAQFKMKWIEGKITKQEKVIEETKERGFDTAVEKRNLNQLIKEKYEIKEEVRKAEESLNQAREGS